MMRAKPKPVTQTGVGATLTADHRNREGEIHGHTWEIMAWFSYDGHDGRVRQRALEQVLAPHQGKCLPDAIAWAEPMAQWLARELEDCAPQRIAISRHNERLYAEWRAP